ncbi:MaoC/PaaZ C-terminal domain-containing protein [Dactylosporangium sp. NPDC005555]|uniref:MaoC/PaaZ C-terminal domain-containing protein n=1 Tax=Dactylosporangium sp. NPDC005555 TaxID=3154889 RepID=UPI0033BC05C4
MPDLERMPRLGPLYRAAALRRGVAADPALPTGALTVGGVTVDRAHLAGYNRVCGFRLRDELPATYLHVVAFPLAMALMTGRDFPFPLLGLIHVRNRAEVHGPLPSSAAFEVSVRADALRPHDKGTQLDIVATAMIDGALVWSSTSTYLRRTVRSSSPGVPSAAPSQHAVWRVPRRVGGDYAAVSGDRNPIHTSRVLAKVFGFPRTIAHGMWTKARCLAALEGRLPGTYTVDAAFKLPILLPATVGFSAVAQGSGWDFGVHDGRSGRPHLTGTVR